MQRLASKFCFLLIAAAFSTVVVMADEQGPSNLHSYPDLPAILSDSSPSPTAEFRVLSVFDPNDTLIYPKNLSLRWLQTTPSPPPKPTKLPVEKIKRAAINPSMVGYIDDAVITSEVRVRFDAALHDATPDRAEFFYAKCGCYKSLPTTSPAYDPNAPGPGPGIPTRVNFQQLHFYGEYAPSPRLSLFVQLPFRWLQPNSGSLQAFPSAGGFGDMHLGIRAAPIATAHSYLTLQFMTSVPSGDATKGLGTNHSSIEPSLLYYQRLSDRFSVEAEVGDTHPLSSSAGVPTAASHGFAGDVFFYGAGPSYQFVNTEQLHLAGVLEFVGWNVRGGYVTGPTNPSTAGINIVNLKVGPRLSYRGHHSFYFGFGVALTSQNWYKDIFRTEYRYTF